MAKATKKAAPKKAASKKASGKRTTIAPNADKRYVRRNAKGQITESDDQGRSLSADAKQSAKKKVPSGQGDKGDGKKRTSGKKSASAKKGK